MARLATRGMAPHRARAVVQILIPVLANGEDVAHRCGAQGRVDCAERPEELEIEAIWIDSLLRHGP